MDTLPKCFLLPIDGKQESLRPARFLAALYPHPETIQIILCYFIPPLPPVYQEKPDSPEMLKKLKAFRASRHKSTRAVFERAKHTLVSLGFSSEHLQEHVEEKAPSVGRQTCLLADREKVDAVLLPKQVSSSLEAILTGDISPSLLQHCSQSPVWFTEGTIDTHRAVVLMEKDNASLRAADHAAFMLEETQAGVTLLHVSKSVQQTISSPAFRLKGELDRWLATPAADEVKRQLMQARDLVRAGGVAEERIDLVILPQRGNISEDITAYCREESVGIMVLGHSHPTGMWSFLKSSVTKKMLTELKDMALWVNQ